MSNAFVDQFVEPITDEQVEMLQKDNIHHSAWTSRKIMASICKHAQLHGSPFKLDYCKH